MSIGYSSLIVFRMLLEKGSTARYIDTMLILFHNLVPHEYWVLTESRIPFMLVLGCVKIFIVVFPDRAHLLFEEWICYRN